MIASPKKSSMYYVACIMGILLLVFPLILNTFSIPLAHADEIEDLQRQIDEPNKTRSAIEPEW